MRVKIKRINEKVHFQGFGSSKIPVNVDGSPEIGGENFGVRPMELILMGLGTCGAMDIVTILKKQRQDLQNFDIEINGERDYDQNPAVFTNIDVHFIFTGSLDPNKVEKAVKLSMEKYCSVSAMLETTVKINYSYTINEIN